MVVNVKQGRPCNSWNLCSNTRKDEIIMRISERQQIMIDKRVEHCDGDVSTMKMEKAF
jgi:hypothetical protein